MDANLRVLVVDDHPIFREGVLRVLERQPAISVVGVAVDGTEALDKIRALSPDVALLDVEMPGLSGIDVARKVYKEALFTNIVLLTMYRDTLYFNTALDLGVRGYLLKDSVIGELVQCLTAVSEGRYYISPSMSNLLADRMKKIEDLRGSLPAIGLLTPAERSVLRLLADNLTSKEIAGKLSISPRTVENHRLHMCHKLSITGHNKLLQFALQHRSEL